MVERALAGHPLVDEAAHGVVLAFPIVSLVIFDELDRAEAALAAANELPKARRSLITITVIQHWSAVVAFRRGDLVGARAHAQRELAACNSDDWTLYGAWIRANLARTLIEQGEFEPAGAMLADAEAVDPVGSCLLLEAKAWLATALGNLTLAYDTFTEAGRTLDAMGLVNPGLSRGGRRAAAATAAQQVGGPDDAIDLVAADLDIARRTGTQRSIRVALRAAALLAPPDEAVPMLGESVTTLTRSTAPLELAASLTAFSARCDVPVAAAPDANRSNGPLPSRPTLGRHRSLAVSRTSCALRAAALGGRTAAAGSAP
ncbi:MAG: hypothetical protein ACR2KJ_17805 [Jatrophihabitans sp.]